MCYMYLISNDADNTVTSPREWADFEMEIGMRNSEVRTLTGNSNSVLSAGFSPDGKLIVTGSGDRTAKLWDAQTGREIE
ncbi:MAG: hypothetical protein Q8O94_02640 [bacterium]|nr:hypothetical protein [bacterium]